MSDSRVLVVGTTRDYIHYIDTTLPGRAVFLTDPVEYEGAPCGLPADHHLIVPLNDQGSVLKKLRIFLRERNIMVTGVACYDCESLTLAAKLAETLGKPFTSIESVLNSRDKFRSKKLWESAGVPCPRVTMARSDKEVLSFMGTIDGPAVLKPATLSGSELTFISRWPAEALIAFAAVRDGLRSRIGSSTLDRDGLLHETVLCEEFIDGHEFSCDFVCSGSGPRIIRIARKHILEGGPAGTTMAYEVPATDLPIPLEAFSLFLEKATGSLGLERCMGMADFIFREGIPCFIEITPRPGGDCLPPLVRASCGLDMLAAQIDFAENKPILIPGPGRWRNLIGLRVHSERPGLLLDIGLDAGTLPQEIIETHWIRKKGEHVILPPDDYKSWLLGHVIFATVDGIPVIEQIRQVRAAVKVGMEMETVV